MGRTDVSSLRWLNLELESIQSPVTQMSNCRRIRVYVCVAVCVCVCVGLSAHAGLSDYFLAPEVPSCSSKAQAGHTPSAALERTTFHRDPGAKALGGQKPSS